MISTFYHFWHIGTFSLLQYQSKKRLCRILMDFHNSRHFQNVSYPLCTKIYPVFTFPYMYMLPFLAPFRSIYDFINTFIYPSTFSSLLLVLGISKYPQCARNDRLTSPNCNAYRPHSEYYTVLHKILVMHAVTVCQPTPSTVGFPDASEISRRYFLHNKKSAENSAPQA